MPMDDNPSPFNWGLRSLELDMTALANDAVSLRSCDARFKDNTDLSIPKDGIVDPVDIRKVLTGCGSVTIYLAIPVSPSGPTSADRTPEDIASSGQKTVLESEWENSGGESAEHPLGHRRMQARLLLTGQDHSGCEVLPLCRIERLSPEKPPEIDPTYVPPLLVIDGWPPLMRHLVPLSELIRGRVDTLLRETKLLLEPESTIEGYRPRIKEPPTETETLRRLSALNGVASCLDGIAYLPGRPPAALYAELCSLVARLEVLNSARQPVELPPYDHEDLGRCFRAVIMNIKVAMPIRHGTAALEIATGDRPDRSSN